MPVFEPIGVFHSGASFKAESPRQGIFHSELSGDIQLHPGHNFETALRDLEGFDRIWILYQFDRNANWRPTTRPPIPPKHGDRVGVFASRSPYRPNPIGMSAVRLLQVKGLCLCVSEADLLDGTPILDIKPYIPAFDSFPEARAGWLEEQCNQRWNVVFSPDFAEQSQWIESKCGHDLVRFSQVQLSDNPFDYSRKRVSMDESATHGILAFRTWRIHFIVDREKQEIALLEVRTGYNKKDLEIETPDPYDDKETHRDFLRYFPEK